MHKRVTPSSTPLSTRYLWTAAGLIATFGLTACNKPTEVTVALPPAAPSAEVQAQIAGLFVYPVKSCGGVALNEAVLTETGLDLDRAWMVVDTQGEFVSQRELPRLALVSSPAQAVELLTAWVQPGDQLLLKASRGVALEQMLPLLATRWADPLPRG